MPLGVLDTGFIRSNSVLLEVNDFGVVIGGDTYETEYDWREPQATEEVKLLNPSGPHFSLWDLPYMLEPRTKHAAVALPGMYLESAFHCVSHLLTKNTVISFHTASHVIFVSSRIYLCNWYNMEKERWTHCKKLDRPIQNHAAASHVEMVRLSDVRKTMSKQI